MFSGCGLPKAKDSRKKSFELQHHVISRRRRRRGLRRRTWRHEPQAGA
jgi:hypothetical protein